MPDNKEVRAVYVRVKDRDTGHEFDVIEGDYRIGGPLQLVNKPAYPPAYQPRPPKHHIGPVRGPKPKPSKATDDSKTKPRKAAGSGDKP